MITMFPAHSAIRRRNLSTCSTRSTRSACHAGRILIAIALMLGVCACGTPYRPPQPLDRDTAFPGLIDLAAQADGRVAEVLLVHGICTHDAGWAATVVTRLMQSLKSATAPTTPDMTARPAGVGAADGPQVEIVPSIVETPAGRLRFDALIWSPLTAPLKRQLCYDQSDKSSICQGEPPYPHARANLNARLKDVLIDDCLPDALIYQGVARDTIQRRMREAILRVLADGEAASKLPLVVVSHSMGSKIMFDTLLRMSEEEPGSRASLVARQAMDRLRYLVMAANQIPLLSLADQPIAASGANLTAVPADSLQLLLQQRLGRRSLLPRERRLTLVAFTDPNDLLSYTLPPERYASEDVTVYNILVSNAPTYLGLLERPDHAHLNYLTNPDVGRLIACGLPTSRLCNP